MSTTDAGPIPRQPTKRARNQAQARRVLDATDPFPCCAVCGLQIATCLQVAHLDQEIASNNAPDNLARLCLRHHWMYDAGLYPVEAIRLLQAHWKAWYKKGGIPDHSARMKNAGPKAARKRKHRAAARKAVATRLLRAKSKPAQP